MKKKLNNLVADIYSVLDSLTDGNELNISEEMFEEFGKDMTDALRHWATPQNVEGKPVLRMSNVGRPERRLWFDTHTQSDTTEKLQPSTQIKFLYGHLLEVLILFFVKLSGHKLTSQQKEITVSGIKGHMDCMIDGEVVDVKTASGYAFKKFKEGTLAEDDAFGYLSQLAGYEAAEKTNAGGFLVMNKETGDSKEVDYTVDKDECNRPGTTMEALAGLKPVFDPENGSVTAGNSSQLSDGASVTLVMSEEKALELGLKPLAYFRGFTTMGCEPDEMGIGPVYSVPKLLKSHNMSVDDIDLWELNEAFAVQVAYCRDQLGISMDKLNVNGGSISIGHPFGMTGSRQVGHIVRELSNQDKQFGIVTMCVGGGMGATGLFERYPS